MSNNYNPKLTMMNSMKPGEYVVNKNRQGSAFSHHSYPDELCECVVDVGSAWHEETTAGTQIMEEEQLLILWSREKAF